MSGTSGMSGMSGTPGRWPGLTGHGPSGRKNSGERLRPFLPAFLLALFAGYAGTFVGAATGAGATLGHLALALVLFTLGGRPGLSSDPLGLGARGRFLLAALALSALASLFASAVPRAGRAGLVVALLIVLLAPVVARAFAADRVRAEASVSAVVGLIAAFALVAWLCDASPRPALPLGHHGLLAGWLAILLPLAWLPAVRSVKGPHGSLPLLALGVASTLLGVVAILATRSAAGLAAVVVEAGVSALWLLDRRARRALALAALVGALALAPRALAILAGRDGSATVRQVYLEGGLQGWAERPLLGWGPGSTPWTLAPHLTPVPGANPPGEAVGELHALPLTLGYELGIAGFLLALAVTVSFGRKRWLEERKAHDPLRSAGLLGLLGGALVALGSGAWSVTALPIAALIAAGAALAPGLPISPHPPRRAERAILRVVVVAAVLILGPLDFAHLCYDRALGTDRAGSIAALDTALAADPSFPLYRARRAAYRANATPRDAESALRAARDSGDVGPLWLLAGQLGVEARRPWSGAALDRACRAAPFDALAPWLRLRALPEPTDTVSIAARALLAEPQLAAAIEWQGRENLRRAAVARIERLPGVDRGWRRALVEGASRLPAGRGEAISYLTYGAETENGSFSLHWFRRRPWGAYLGGVALSSEAVAAIELPAATRLPETSGRLFASADCRLGDRP